VSWQSSGGDLARTAVGQTSTLASDGDRDAAARVLNEALAEGRLTADEHGERVRAAYAARTWPELARLTADLPGPADAAGRAAAGGPDGLDRCLLCALLIVCPPAGIAWLLASRHRARAGQRRALTVTSGPSSHGPGDDAARAGDERRAEDR
jgi:uncharacterized protein DUF1707